MSEKSAFDLIKNNQSIYCGLTVGEFIQLLNALSSLWHVVDEGDWDRLAKDTIDDIETFADIMTKHKCVCPPHGLITPTEAVRILKINIKKKEVGRPLSGKAEALSSISQLLFSLLEAARYDLVKSILPTRFLT